MRVNLNAPQIFNNFSKRPALAMKPPAARAPGDIVNISGQGMALSGKLRGGGDGLTVEKPPASQNPEVNLMKRTISEAEKILHKMLDISSAASGKNLSADERIDMQIQMTKLQAQLYKKTYGMSVDIASKGDNRNFTPNLLNAIDYDEKMTIKMLERERARLQTGGATQNSDVLLLEQRVATRVENTPQSHGLKEMYFDKELGKLTVLDEWSMQQGEDGAIAITGARARDLAQSSKVISDGDRLARANLSLLSEESSRTSAEKVQRQIAGLKKMASELENVETTAAGETVATSGASSSEAGHDSVVTAVGMMRSRQASFAKNPLAGHDLDSADVRLESAQGATGKMFQKLDVFLKDSVHKSLGLGGMWDNVQNITSA